MISKASVVSACLFLINEPKLVQKFLPLLLGLFAVVAGFRSPTDVRANE